MNYKVRKKNFNGSMLVVLLNYFRARARYYANSYLSRYANRSIFL